MFDFEIPFSTEVDSLEQKTKTNGEWTSQKVERSMSEHMSDGLQYNLQEKLNISIFLNLKGNEEGLLMWKNIKMRNWRES